MWGGGDARGEPVSIYRFLTPPGQELPRWSAFGVLFFVLLQGLLGVFEAPRFWWPSLYASGLLVAIPVVVLRSERLFHVLASEVGSLFQLAPEELRSWLRKEAHTIFDPARSLLAGAVFSALATGTVLASGQVLPRGGDLAVLALVQPAYFVAGQGAYFMIAVYRFQHRVARLPVAPRFLDDHAPAIARLMRDSYVLALVVLALYLGGFGVVVLGPYGINALTMPWLLLTSFYPVASFSWSLVQIHHLQQRIKWAHLDAVGRDLAALYQDARRAPSLENLERLSVAVELREAAASIRSWPLSFQTVSTLVLTIGAAVSQIIIVILRPVGL